MPQLLHISEAASLALHTMVFLAANPGEQQTTRDIARRLAVSDNHLSKVMQRLGRAGLVTSRRGPGGGFLLGRPAGDITLLEIYETMEGPLNRNNCLFREPTCNGGCFLGGLLDEVNSLVHSRLQAARLSDLGFSYIIKGCENA